MTKMINGVVSSTTGLPVMTIDDSGNQVNTGNVTVGGAVYLNANATAPVQQPGQVALYSADGKSVSYVGAGGQVVQQTVSGGVSAPFYELNNTGTAITGANGGVDNAFANTVRLYNNQGGPLQLVQAAASTVDTYANGNKTLSVGGANVAVAGATASGLATITNTTTTTTPDLLFTENAATSLALGTEVAADTNPRWTVGADGKFQWGPGNGASDLNLYRSAAGLLKTDNSLTVAGTRLSAGVNLLVNSTSATGLGDNGAGTVSVADVTTAPTTNPTGGSVVYSQSGTATPLKVRDVSGNVRSVVDGYFQLTTNPTFNSASQTASTVLLAVEANATYLMENFAIFTNTTGSTTFSWTGPSGATMQWNDTTGSSDYTSTIGGNGFTWTSNATARMVIHKGLLITSTTAGSLTLTLAVSAGTTTLNSGTMLRLTRVK